MKQGIRNKKMACFIASLFVFLVPCFICLKDMQDK